MASDGTGEAAPSAVYPIGRLELPTVITGAHVVAAVDALAAQPERLRRVLAGVDDADRPIRPGAWTTRQVVVHLADSHGLALTRTQVALCGADMDIAALDGMVHARLYACIAKRPDVAATAVQEASDVFDLVQRRWVRLLRSLDDAQRSRSWTVPQYRGPRTIARITLAYAWHGDHHIAQIERSAATA